MPPQPELIAETIQLIAFIARTAEGRRVTELVRVEGYDPREGFKLASSGSLSIATESDARQGVEVSQSKGGSRDEVKLRRLVERSGRRAWATASAFSRSRCRRGRWRRRRRRQCCRGIQPLNTLQTDLQGPVAHAVTTAAISAPASSGR